MTIKEMMETITKVEKERKIYVYITYDVSLGWKFKIYSQSPCEAQGYISRIVPTNQIAIWNTDILERFLGRIADDLEIGVIG